MNKTKKISLAAMMLSMIIVLLWLERMLPPLPFLPPNLKLGLSNVVIMYALLFIGKREAAILVVLKAFFNTLLRGPLGGLLSLYGGLLSLLCMFFLLWLFRERISYIALSIVAAIMHNIGQLIVISLLFQSFLLFSAYLPFLLIASIILGIGTAVLLKTVLPVLGRLGIDIKKE